MSDISSTEEAVPCRCAVCAASCRALLERSRRSCHDLSFVCLVQLRKHQKAEQASCPWRAELVIKIGSAERPLKQ